MIAGRGSGLRSRSFGERGPVQRAWDIGSGPAAPATVERDSATLSIFGAGTLRNPLDLRTAGGADQRFLVAVCGDQNQRFGCPVFLDTPTSHGRPSSGAKWHRSGYPAVPNYAFFSGRAKV
jgi:hypothetical protein